MRQFKKKTIALCLASAITALGAFGAENYSNSLVSLRINNGSNGLVNLTAFTRRPLETALDTKQIDNDTYYINLPETYSEIVNMPELTTYDNIESIQVSTFPYTPESKGYTRIYVKTKGRPLLKADSSLYIQDMSNATSQTVSQPENKIKKESGSGSYWDKHEANQTKINKTNAPVKKTSANAIDIPQKKHTYKKPEKQNNIQQENFPINYNETNVNSSHEGFVAVIGVFIITALIMFIFFMSKDKMAAVVGEQNDIDLDDEPKEKSSKRKKIKNIKTTINKLDKTYLNKHKLNDINIVTGEELNSQPGKNEEINSEDNATENIVVDLDSIYNESQKVNNQQVSSTEESSINNSENDDLADFLESFSFDESEPVQEEKVSYDEEFYDKFINSENLTFTNNDIHKINELMQDEISTEAMDNISDFAPKVPVKISNTAKLENLLAEYKIKQNLSFSKEDVDAIKKIMTSELDQNFISDLRTNPARTAMMEKEINEHEKSSRKEPVTNILNVKDMLPDLSKELIKLGGKRVESNAKPEVVYYSEGYDFQKLSVNSELSNISQALQTKDAQTYRPSDELVVSETGYEVETLHIKDELPDLSNYKTEPKLKSEKPKVDEKTLLASIANVTFKPFYDETEDIEENTENEVNNEQQTVIEPENDNIINSINTHSDDIPENTETVIANDVSEGQTQIKPEILTAKNINTEDDDTQKLLKLIETQQSQRKDKLQTIKSSNEQLKKELKNNKTKQEINQTCKLDGTEYNIISSAQCDGDLVCCLIKDNEGYSVLGKVNNFIKKLKHYDSLRTENIQTRINEKLADGSIQYLVRVSVHKFIVNVTSNSMEFIMDLC